MEGSRPARSDDVERIAQLSRELREEVLTTRGGPLWGRREARPEPLEEAYADLVDSPDARVVVGTFDDAVLGFGVGELDRLHDGAILGVISDLYVEPGGRAVGIGEAMAEALLDWFSERGCVGVDAWALPGARQTKNFFEDHGFVSRAIVVHRSLVSEDAERADPTNGTGRTSDGR